MKRNIKNTYSLLTSALILGIALVLVPVSVGAEVIVRSGESVSVEKDQKIEGNFYTAASIINISGEITEDLTAVGGRVTLNGPVKEDAIFIGGGVDVHGPVGDDLWVVGGDVVIAEPISGDVVVIGGSIKVLSTATIGGDVLIYGGDADISGSIGGDIVGQVSTLRLDGVVSGSVDVTTTILTLGDRTNVSGSVRYISEEVVLRAPNAQVGGEITRNDPVVQETESDLTIRTVLVPLLMMMFAALVWYLIARRLLVKVVERALVPSVRSTVTGFVTFFATPAVMFILLASVLGTFVGFVGLIGYLLLILLSLMSMSAVCGQLIVKLYTKTPKELSPVTLAIGVSVLTLCLFIPFVGPAVLFVFFIITLGALVDLLIRPDSL